MAKKIIVVESIKRSVDDTNKKSIEFTCTDGSVWRKKGNTFEQIFDETSKLQQEFDQFQSTQP